MSNESIERLDLNNELELNKRYGQLTIPETWKLLADYERIVKELGAVHQPSLSDAIKEVEKMRAGWLNASNEAHSVDNGYSFLQRAEAAKMIINALESLGPQRED